MSTGHFKIKGTQNLLYSVCPRYVSCSVKLLASTLLFALTLEIWAIFLLSLGFWTHYLFNRFFTLFICLDVFVCKLLHCFIFPRNHKFFIFSLTFDRRCLVFNRCVWVCVFAHLKGKSKKDSKDEYWPRVSLDNWNKLNIWKNCVYNYRSKYFTYYDSNVILSFLDFFLLRHLQFAWIVLKSLANTDLIMTVIAEEGVPSAGALRMSERCSAGHHHFVLKPLSILRFTEVKSLFSESIR